MQSLEWYNREIESRNSTLSVYEDYYIGTGRQWALKGQITRSGTYLVDKIDQDVPYGDFYKDTGKGLIYEAELTGTALNQIKRKRRWAEANVIDLAFKETARAVKGVGNFKYEAEEVPTQIIDEFKMFMKINEFPYMVQDISEQIEIYGFKPILMTENKLVYKDASDFYQVDSETWVEYKRQQQKDVIEFFKENYNLEVDPKTEYVEYNAVYTSEFIKYYVNGKIVLEIPHNLGYCPVQAIIHRGGSSVKNLIEIQDQINMILTETSEVFKANLNPSTIISDDNLLAQATSIKSRTGKNMAIEKQAGSVYITGKDGKVQLVQWNGVPTGIIDILSKWEAYYKAKRGISLKQDDSFVAESAAAKIEDRRTLFAIAEDIREEINLGVQKLFNVWLGYRGFMPEMIDIIFPPMFETSKKEQAELEVIHFGVHQNKKLYMERVGDFTTEEIEMMELEKQEQEATLLNNLQS